MYRSYPQNRLDEKSLETVPVEAHEILQIPKDETQILLFHFAYRISKSTVVQPQ